MGDANKTMSFWEHLDELRDCIIRILLVVSALAVLAFCFKTQLFDVVLAPHDSDFITYKLMKIPPFDIKLMNVGLTEQFMVHLKVAMYAGLLLASPFVLYQLFRFVSPALYASERKFAVTIVASSYVMFILGTLVNYFIVFPLTLRFLGTYQVSKDVSNMLTINSYINTLISMSFVMGVVFLLPVICWILGRMGVITSGIMSQYRRHAIVAILIVAAIITPTTDMFTLIVVALPIWLLYEISIQVVKISDKSLC